MKQKLLSLVMLLPLMFGLCTFTSCSNDDNDSGTESEFTPTSSSNLLGLYTYEDVADHTDFMRAALFFCDGNRIVIYVDTTCTDDGAALINGDYNYDPNTGLGVITQDDGINLDFFADEAGFVVLYDEDSKYEEYREGVWFIKQDYDLEAFNDSIKDYYFCGYDDDFGCETYNPDCVLDINDIGYQPDDTRGTRADFEWTIASVASWAGSNLISSAAGAIGSTAVNAIMTQIGAGMGAQLNEISLKLDQIQKQLETVLQKIGVVLDNQAEAQFNVHKSEVNSLANTILHTLRR